MSIIAVETALEQRLQGMPNVPPIAWEDVSYTPKTGVAYLKVYHLHNTPRDKYLEGGSAELVGIFQVTVVHPAGKGNVAAKLLAERVAAVFDPVQELEAGNHTVSLTQTPAIAAGTPDEGGWYEVPISIPWRAFPA